MKLLYLLFLVLLFKIDLNYAQIASVPFDRVLNNNGDDEDLGKGGLSGNLWEENGSLIVNYYIYLGAGGYYVEPLYYSLDQAKINFYTGGTIIFSRFEIKYDNGSWKVIIDNKAKTETGLLTPPFTTIGQHTIYIKFWDEIGDKREVEINTIVVPAITNRFHDNYGNTIDLWAGGLDPLNRPLLFVEGFDPANKNYQELYFSLSKNLIPDLLNLDADVFILNFAEGGADMLENASVVTSAIQFLNHIKSGLQKQIVLGLSMGGVVSRYALTKAETDGLNLDVSHFISVDSPQHGALIDSDLMDAIYADDPENIELKSMAAKQLLRYNPFAKNDEHFEFYNLLSHMQNFGYPSYIENISVSFSPNTPNPNSGEWLTIKKDLITDQHFYIQSSDPWHDAGSYLPLSTTMQFGSKIGGLIDWEFVRYKDPTFIQYNSAHDIVNGASQFDVNISSSIHSYHDNFPEDVIQPIVDILHLSPTSLVEVTFSNITVDDRNAGGPLKLTKSDGSILNITSGEKESVLANENHKVETIELFRENFQESGLNFKHHHWNSNKNEYLAYHWFPGFENNNTQKSYFFETANILMKNSMNTLDGVEIRDPWFKNAAGVQPDDFVAMSEISASGSHSVFTGQGYSDPSKPFYSVKAAQTQTVPFHGENIDWYFQGWSGTDVGFENANAAETGIVFNDDYATATANYKGHLVHAQANAYSKNQRRLLTDGNTWVLVYPDGGDIWCTYSFDGGVTWTKEVRLNYTRGNAINPSISNLFAFSGNNNDRKRFAVIWEEKNGTGNEEIHIQTFQMAMGEFEQPCYGWSVYCDEDRDVSHRVISYASDYVDVKTNAQPVLELVQEGNNMRMYLAFEDNNYVINVASYLFEGNGYNSLEDIAYAPSLDIMWEHYIFYTGPSVNSSQPVLLSYPAVYGQPASVFLYYIEYQGSNSSRIGQYPICFDFSVEPNKSLLALPYNSTNVYALQGAVSRNNAMIELVAEFNRSSGGWQTGVYKKYPGSTASLATTYTNMKQPVVMVENQSGYSTLNSQIIMRSTTNSNNYYQTNSYTTPALYTSYAAGVLAQAQVAAGNRDVIHVKNDYSPARLRRFPENQLAQSIEGFTAEKTFTTEMINQLLTPDTDTLFSVLSFPGPEIELIDSLQDFTSLAVVTINDISENQLLCKQLDSLLLNLEIIQLRDGVSVQTVGFNTNELSLSRFTDLHVGDLLVIKTEPVYQKLQHYKNVIIDESEEVDQDARHLIDELTIEDPFTFGAYPNPFNPSTSVRFHLKKADHVKLEIYNIRGQLVSTLIDRELSAGNHSAIFDGSALSSGIYIYRLQAGNFVDQKKMLLVR